MQIKFGEKPFIQWSTDCVTATKFLDRNQYLISSGDDNAVLIHDINNGDIIRKFVGHRGRVLGMDVSPDGQYFLTSSADKIIRLWNIETGKSNIIADLNPYDSIGITYRETFPVIFSPYSNQVVYAVEEMLGNYKLVFVSIDFHRQNITQTKVLTEGMGHVSKIQYSTDTALLGFSVQNGYSNHEIEIWDPKQEKCIKTLEGYWFEFDHHNTYLAVAMMGKNTRDLIQIFDFSTLEVQNSFSSHIEGQHSATSSGNIRALKFSPNKCSNILASAGDDNLIFLWNVSQNKNLPIARLSGHTAPITCLAFSSDGKILASGTGTLKLRGVNSGDRTIRLWEINNILDFQYETQLHQGDINGLVTAHERQEAITVGKDGDIKFWSILNGDQSSGSILAFPEETESRFQKIEALCFFSGQRENNIDACLIVANSRGKIKLFYINDKMRTEEIIIFENSSIRSLDISSDKKLLAVGNNENVRVLNILTKQQIYSYAAPAKRINFLINNSGKLLLGISGNNLLSVLDGNTGELIYQPTELKKIEGSGFGVGGVEFSPINLHRIASICNFRDSNENIIIGTTIVWDIQQKEEKFQFSKRNCYVNCIDFSPTGKFLAAGYSSGEIVIWNIEERVKACTIDIFKNKYSFISGISVVKFLDVNQFFTGQHDNGSLQKWRLEEINKSVIITLQWHTANTVVLSNASFNQVSHLDGSNRLLAEQKGAKIEKSKPESFITPLYNQQTTQMQAQKNNEKIQSLCMAAKANDVLKLKQLVEKGIDVNESYEKGYTALHYACQAGSIDAILYLEDQGGNIEKGLPQNQNKTPKSLFSASNLLLYQQKKEIRKNKIVY